ncbi:MAG: hypothetical protein MPK31_09060 [Gammaproteobacteria bacterium]|nr:hypothetical protein [Gammaproteobacteria bacterium]MDA8001946.1 hypothetical protein [Alphaproteobacteria bacterium]
MKHTTNPRRLHRRDVLKAGGGLIAMTALPAGMIVGAQNAWSATAKSLKPETFATLVQACRDIYPHDMLSDAYYAKAVQKFDEEASGDADLKSMLEKGVSALDRAAGKAHDGFDYRAVGWEQDRVALLRSMESGDFFQKLRGDLVTGIYNNQEVWPMFGYEGESASKGGYIRRGFNDINWL